MNTRGLAIVGTGTGVGKTVVTAALALSLRRAGERIAVWKPVATGGIRRGGQLVSGDAAWVKRVLGLPEPVESLCGACYRLPLAPAVAARAERRPLDLVALRTRWRELGASGRFLLVEGIGGVLVPLKGSVTVGDFVAETGLPAIVVAPAGLGTINHALLSIEALRARGVRVAGVVLNGARGRDISEKTNAGAIQGLGRVPVLAILPRIPGIRRDPAALRRLAGRLPAGAILRAGGRAR